MLWFKRALKMLMNERGAVGDAGGEQKEAAKDEKLLPQSQVDAIVQDRLARERQKYADYEDLRKFKIEHEKAQDAQQLKILEEQKKYEEALKIHTTKLNELQGLVAKKDSDLASMRIETALSAEVNKQNAYAEETMALLKSQATFDKEGNVRIKGRDANGLEVEYSVEEGVKQFLTKRPHLVKIDRHEGGGTPRTVLAGGSVIVDQNTLNAQMLDAIQRGDHKKAAELRPKIREALKGQAVA